MLPALLSLLLALVALSAAPAHAQVTLAPFSPAAFDSARAPTTSDLLFLYALENNGDCAARSLPNAVSVASSDLLGDVTFPPTYSPSVKCPSVPSPSGTILNAHNGVRFQGSRAIAPSPSPLYATDDSLTTANTVASLYTSMGLGVKPFTLEMWLKPAFASGPDTKTYVLLEIGDTVPASAGSAAWNCEGAPGTRKFDLRVVYDSNAQQIKMTYRTGTGDSQCVAFTALNSTAFVLAAGEVYQLTMAASAGGGSGQEFILRLNGPGGPVSDYFSSFVPIWQMNLDNFANTNKLRFGSSGATFSSDGSATAFNSWNGDILMAAMYKTQLTPTQIDALYTARLPNSRPAAIAATTAAATEDAFTAVSMPPFFYDLDVDKFSATALTYELTAGVTAISPNTSPGGTFRLNGAGTDADLGALPLAFNTLTYRADADVYTRAGVAGRFQVRADDGAATSASALVTVNIAAVNDMPEARNYSTPVSTSQSTSSKLAFRAFDKDCQTADNIPSGSCAAFGSSKTVQITAQTSPPLGVLYRPDGTGACLGFDAGATGVTPGANVTLPFSTTLTGANELNVTLCFEACLGLTGDNVCPALVNNEATLGTHTFEFTVTDAASPSPSTSAPGFVSTLVTSVLDVDVDAVERYPEDTVSVVTLKGVDNFCFQNPTDPDCGVGNPREPLFVLSSLPDPAQVVLFLDENLTQPVLANVNFSGVMYMQPASNYFSTDSWPLCGDQSGSTFSRCPDGQPRSDFPCVGPSQLCTTPTPTEFYQAFTTRDLSGNAMGTFAGCDGSMTQGCPVELTYKMLVLDLESREATGMRVYIENRPDPVVINIPAPLLENKPRDTEVPLTDATGTPISLSDPDGDTRVLELILRLQGSSTEGLVVITSTAGTDPELFKVTSNQGSLTGALSFTIQGVMSQLNLVLPNLRYKTTGSNLNDIVEIIVNDVTRDQQAEPLPSASPNITYFQVTETVSLTLQPEDDGSSGPLSLPTVALYGIIGGGGLCCIGFCCGLCFAVLSAARRGNRTARWVLKNVLFSKLQAVDDEDGERNRQLQKEMSPIARATAEAVRAEHARLEEVQWCVHLLACICPCCVKFNSDKDLVPDEEKILVAVNDSLRSKAAAQHVPREKREKSVRLVVTPNEIFDWEKHEYVDEKTGATHAYYYNAKTGQSSWLQPTVRRSVNTPERL